MVLAGSRTPGIAIHCWPGMRTRSRLRKHFVVRFVAVRTARGVWEGLPQGGLYDERVETAVEVGLVVLL